jgi:hypothetical protein
MIGKNYTRLPIGTKINGSEIKTCPECGEPGLLETTDAKTYYTHGDIVEFGENGEFEVKFVMHSGKQAGD